MGRGRCCVPSPTISSPCGSIGVLQCFGIAPAAAAFETEPEADQAEGQAEGETSSSEIPDVDNDFDGEPVYILLQVRPPHHLATRKRTGYGVPDPERWMGHDEIQNGFPPAYFLHRNAIEDLKPLESTGERG